MARRRDLGEWRADHRAILLFPRTKERRCLGLGAGAPEGATGGSAKEALRGRAREEDFFLGGEATRPETRLFGRGDRDWVFFDAGAMGVSPWEDALPIANPFGIPRRESGKSDEGHAFGSRRASAGRRAASQDMP